MTDRCLRPEINRSSNDGAHVEIGVRAAFTVPSPTLKRDQDKEARHMKALFVGQYHHFV